MRRHSVRLVALIAALSLVACETGAVQTSAVEQHDDVEKQCAELKRQIRLAQRDETTNRNYATAAQIRANSALERLEKHKPYLKIATAAVDYWQVQVDKSGAQTAWAHATSAILFVVEGLSLIKLGSALRTTGKACTTLGIKGATRAAYQFTKREITDAFGKGTLAGTKKVFGMAIRKGAPAGLLTGINAQRYFEYDDWSMAVPIYGTYQEHELKIAMINSYGDALREAIASRDATKEIVAGLEKDVAAEETKVKDFTTKADAAKKKKEDLQAQLQALMMQKQQCSIPEVQDTEDTTVAFMLAGSGFGADGYGSGSGSDTGSGSGSGSGIGSGSDTGSGSGSDGSGSDGSGSDGSGSGSDEPVCLECQCGTWDDGDVDLPDGADFEWLDEVDDGIEPDRVIDSLDTPYIVNYDSGDGAGSGGTP